MNGEKFSPEEVEGIDRELQETLDAGAPLPDARMHEALGAFRARLVRHRMVRKMERERRRDWRFMLRRTFRYASLTLIIVFLGASLTAGGRRAMGRGALSLLTMADHFVKVRVDAGYISYQNYSQVRSAAPVTTANALVERCLGLSSDRTHAILLTRVMTPDGDPRHLANRAIWSVDLTSGRFEAIQKERVVAAHPMINPKRDGTIQALAYITDQSGIWSTCKAVASGTMRGRRLWFYDLKSAPVPIDDGDFADTHFEISPDAKKIFYHRITPAHPEQTLVVDLNTREKTVWPEVVGFESAVGWAPDGNSIVVINQIPTTVGLALNELKRLALDGRTVQERLELPHDRSMNAFPLFDGVNELVLSHNVMTPLTFSAGASQGVSHYMRHDLFSIQPLRRLEAAPAERPGLVDWAPYSARVVSPNWRYTYDTSAILDAQSRRKVLSLDGWMMSNPSQIIWSPDSRRIACVLSNRAGGQSENLILDVPSGEIKKMKLARWGLDPLAWLDSDRVLWTGRTEFYIHAYQDENDKPKMEMTISDLKTGKVGTLTLHE